MGIFGSASPMGWGDMLYLAGAGLKDASPTSQGGNLQAAQQMMLQRMMMGAKLQAAQRLSGLFGGQNAQVAGTMAQAPTMVSPGSGPTMKGPGMDGEPIGPAETPPTYAPPAAAAPSAASLRDPATQQALLGASMFDPEGATFAASLLEKAQPKIEAARPGAQLYDPVTGRFFGRVSNPQYINGYLADPTSANTPGYIPQLKPQTMPDGKGGVMPIPGAVGTELELARAAKLGETYGSVQQKPDEGGGVQTGLGYDLYGPGAGPPGAPAPQAGTGAAAPNSRVGVSPSPQDTEYRKSVATAAATRYNNIIDAGRQAPGAKARLMAMNSLLKGYEGGALAPDMYDIASGLNSLGFKVDPRLSNKDAAQVLSRAMATEAMKNPDTGANLFPRVTNFEYENALKQVPGFMQSAKGRETVIGMKLAEQDRIQTISDFAQKWAQRYGRLDKPDPAGKTFDQYLANWSQQHPLYAGVPGIAPPRK